MAILNLEHFWNLFFIELNLALIDCEQNEIVGMLYGTLFSFS